MKLYYSKGACSLTVRIIVHELNIPCEYEAVNLKTKQTQNEGDYTKINPKGSVPALMLGKEGLLTENAVILQYLADTNHANQLLAPVGEMKRYRTLEWLNFISSDLHKLAGTFFNHQISDEIKEKVYKPLLTNKLNLIEKHLVNQSYLVGNEFTLPDAYLFVILFWIVGLKFDMSQWPNLFHYYSELKKRPSVKKAMEEETLVSA